MSQFDDTEPDVLRMCKALDLCGAMFGLWFAGMIATALLLTSPWQLIPWLGVSFVGTIVLRFIGDTISAELARLSGHDAEV